MVDTTTWRVSLSSNQIAKILSKSKEFSGYDHETKTTTFRILKDNIYIGSYDSNISIRCYEETYALIEFSVPKQYRGNNVELLYPSQLEQALGGIHRSLVDRFGDFPHYMTWKLYRLDLCYGWKYATQAAAIDALNVLKTFDYPRKSKYLYRESVMWRGKISSIKFYLKYNEFKKHDYKKLVKLGEKGFADKLLSLSEGVLRFEITFRKEALNYLFKKKVVTYKDILSEDFLLNTLNRYIENLTMHLDMSIMSDKENLMRLNQVFTNQKAMRLFAFYKLLYSAKLNNRQLLKDHYSPSTIWRNKKDIAFAKVGLPNHTNPKAFTLVIPSDLVVNKN